MIYVNVVYFELKKKMQISFIFHFLCQHKFQFTSSFAEHMYSILYTYIDKQIKIELYFLTGSVLDMTFKIKYQNS